MVFYHAINTTKTGRLLKVSYANEDSAEEKPEDDNYLDPVSFEAQNKGNKLPEIIQGLNLKQKYFILLQFKVSTSYTIEEARFKTISYIEYEGAKH